MIRKKANVLSVGEEFTLSRAEAERRLKIEGYPSLEQIIQRTKAKADWPDERWDEIRRIAAAAEKPDALVVNRKTVFAHIRHCNRWVAAASSLIFVLAVLLIFIPESRAFLLGFSVIVMGLLLNLGLSFLFASNGAATYDQLEPSVAFRNIFYNSKALYSYIFILNAGIFGGTYAVFSTGIFSCTKDFYLGYLYPTIIYNVSTMLFGKLCGLNILPFSTFVMSQTTIEKLLTDHATIIVTGVVLFMSSFIKWRKGARL